MSGQPLQAGFCGAGLMGGAMTARLCALGWRVGVCDPDPERQAAARSHGAGVAPDGKSLAHALAPDGALVVCVVDAAQCRDALFGAAGALHGLRPGHTVLLCPTIAPEDTESLALGLRAAGIDCLDAPLSGGPGRARDGSMSLMLAGPAPVVERNGRLLAALSSRVFRLGERIGDGARVKLVNNLLAGIHLVGAAEALALADRIGLDLSTTLDVIEQSSGQSWIGSDRMRRAIAGDFAPRARLSLLQKDTRLAQQMAHAAGFEGPLGAAAAQAFAEASAAGFEAMDDAALLRWLRTGT